MTSLSLLDLADPSAAPKPLPFTSAPRGCKFQGDGVLTWYAFEGFIGVVTGPDWQVVELPAKTGPFERHNFSWSPDRSRLSFRDYGSWRLQVATHFPTPELQELTTEGVRAFAFRP